MSLKTNIRNACTKYPQAWDALKLLAILAALVAVVALVRCFRHARSASGGGGGAPASWLTARGPTVREGFGGAPYTYRHVRWFYINWNDKFKINNTIDDFYKSLDAKNNKDFFEKQFWNTLKTLIIFKTWNKQTDVLFKDKEDLLLDHPSITEKNKSFGKLIGEVKENEKDKQPKSEIDKHLFKLTNPDNKEDVRMLPEFTCRYDQYIRYLNGHLEMLYCKSCVFGESDTDISGNIHVNNGLINLFLDDNDNVSGGIDTLLNFLHDEVLTTKDNKPNYHDNVDREIILSNMLFVVPQMMLGMQVKEKREKTENTYKYHPNFILPVLFKAVTAYTKKSVKQLVALDYEREVQRLGEDDPKGMSYNELRKPNWFHRMFAQKPNLLNYQIKGFRESVADQLRHTFALLLNIGYLSIQHLVDENFTMGNHGKTGANPMKDTLSYPVFAGRNTFPWYEWYGFLDLKNLKNSSQKTLMVVQKKENRGSKDGKNDRAFVIKRKDADANVIDNFIKHANTPTEPSQTIQEYLDKSYTDDSEKECFKDLSGTSLSAATFDEVEVVEPVIWARQYMQRVNKERRKVLYDQIFENFRMNRPAVRNFVETFKYVVECLDDTDKCTLILDMIKDLPASEPDEYCSDTDNPDERRAKAIKEIPGYEEFETEMTTHSSGGVWWYKEESQNLVKSINKSYKDGYKDLVGAIKTEITLGDNGSKYKGDDGQPVDKFWLSNDEVENKFEISDVKKGDYIQIKNGDTSVYYEADPTRSGSFIESALSDRTKRAAIAKFFENVVESTSQTDLMSSEEPIGTKAAGAPRREQFEPSLDSGKTLTGAWREYVSRLYKSVVEIGIKEFMLELANQLLENRTDPLVGDVSSFSRTARSSYELKSSLDLGDFYY